jgi:hypothetical protein
LFPPSGLRRLNEEYNVKNVLKKKWEFSKCGGSKETVITLKKKTKILIPKLFY